MRRLRTALILAGLAGLLAGVAPAQAQEVETGGAPPEVVGGTPADPGEFPYQVALVYPDAPGIPIRGQFCGGSLISPDTVLTAAHCVVWDLRRTPDGRLRPVTVPASAIEVIAGTTDLGAHGGGDRLAVRRVRVDPDIVVNPSVTFNVFAPDLAILELAGDAGPGAEPVDLAVPGQLGLYPPGTPATVTGWGATEDVLAGPPTVLREATLPVVANADCRAAYGTDFTATRNLCAGDLANGGASACYGDSGGPLVVDNGGEPLQVGVVLGGDGCGSVERPNLYSRVAANAAFLGRYLDPDEVPDPPRRVTITQRGSVLRVSWRPPEFDGGTEITGYGATIPTGGLGLAGTGGQVRHVDIELVDGPLQVGRRYAVKVTAKNAVGTSAPRVRYVTIRPYPIP